MSTANPGSSQKLLDTLIIGGGLSGLSLAYELQRQGRDYLLIEARQRLGGRILSHAEKDLGAAWFWPGQPRIAELIERFTLEVFEQYEEGLVLVQRRGELHAFAQPAQRSYRLAGGMQRLVEALSARIPSSKVHVGSRARTVANQNSHVAVDVEREGGIQRLAVRQVVIAVPPRLIHEYLTFAPALSGEIERQHRESPTWMAGNAKAVIAYPTPFWRRLSPAGSHHQQALSGTAFSETGPLMEIHDASAEDGSQAALFGFFGMDADTRCKYNTTTLEQAIIRQLVALFGPAAARHEGIIIHDWARETMTATTADQPPLTHHPRYCLGARPQWDGRLIFAGSESALQFAGYLEGALVASQAALDLLTAPLATNPK